MHAPTTTRYDNVAKTLHWLIALAIIFMLILGWSMDSLGGLKFRAFQLHKSVGITILLLSLLRLIWRLTHHFPPLPDSMTLWEKYAARLAHIGFYVLIIGMPITGWVIVSTSTQDIPTILYGIIPWPRLPFLFTMENKSGLHHLAGGVHGCLAYIMASLIILHAAAAWKHHLINRDDVLLRMAPGFFEKFLNFLRGQKS